MDTAVRTVITWEERDYEELIIARETLVLNAVCIHMPHADRFEDCPDLVCVRNRTTIAMLDVCMLPWSPFKGQQIAAAKGLALVASGITLDYDK